MNRLSKAAVTSALGAATLIGGATLLGRNGMANLYEWASDLPAVGDTLPTHYDMGELGSTVDTNMGPARINQDYIRMVDVIREGVQEATERSQKVTLGADGCQIDEEYLSLRNASPAQRAEILGMLNSLGREDVYSRGLNLVLEGGHPSLSICRQRHAETRVGAMSFADQSDLIDRHAQPISTRRCIHVSRGFQAGEFQVSRSVQCALANLDGQILYEAPYTEDRLWLFDDAGFSNLNDENDLCGIGFKLGEVSDSVSPYDMFSGNESCAANCDLVSGQPYTNLATNESNCNRGCSGGECSFTIERFKLNHERQHDTGAAYFNGYVNVLPRGDFPQLVDLSDLQNAGGELTVDSIVRWLGDLEVGSTESAVCNSVADLVQTPDFVWLDQDGEQNKPIFPEEADVSQLGSKTCDSQEEELHMSLSSCAHLDLQ